MIDLRTGKAFDAPSAQDALKCITRRKTLAGLAGILATACAPSIGTAASGARRGLGMRGAMMAGAQQALFDGTSFTVNMTSSTGTTLSFVQGCTLLSGKHSYKIEWGDGCSDTYTNSTDIPTHAYPALGEYEVRISNDIARFVLTYYGDARVGGNTYIATTCINKFGDDITSLRFSCRGLENLTGELPTLPVGCTNIQLAFATCRNLVSKVPEYPVGVTSLDRAFVGCLKLYGSIPQWGPQVTNVYAAFGQCRSITGSIPDWLNVTNAEQCYYGCTGLSGVIKQWGSVTNANYTYYQCTGFTGVWDDSAPDSEIMPSSITAHTQTVTGAGAGLRAKFLDTWGGSRTS